jgi:hypothetical protein
LRENAPSWKRRRRYNPAAHLPTGEATAAGDALRGTSDRSNLPSDDHLKSFDAFMKGPRTAVQVGETSPFGRVDI